MKVLNSMAAIVLIAGLGAAAAASASVVTMDARYYGGGATFTDSASYVNEWNTVIAAQPVASAGYGDQTIADWNGGQHNSGVFGANTNIAYHDKVVFDVTTAGTWSFKMGVDFGYGGTLLVDGQALQTQTKDLWWAGNINDPANTLSGSTTLSTGWHTLNVYGFEGCCDGGTTGQYLSPGAASYTSFTSAPEPASWSLMIIGLGAAGGALRRRAAKGAVA